MSPAPLIPDPHDRWPQRFAAWVGRWVPDAITASVMLTLLVALVALAARKNDEPGDLIEDFGDALEELSPMEVSFEAGAAAEVVPVSFESIVTETGMLQLWCVSRDGRRWKLEFNVRERVVA